MVWVIAPTVSIIPSPAGGDEPGRQPAERTQGDVRQPSWGRSRPLAGLLRACDRGAGGPTRDQIDLGMSALSQIDECFPMLAAVIWGGMTAETALLAGTASVPGDEPPALDLAV